MTRRIFALAFLLLPFALRAEESLGYYRFPAIHGDTVVFAAEGDLWRVDRRGGVATRLTTHPAEESNPAISPDGRTIAFSAAYEGPTEVYTMPVDGGLPVRRTFEGEGRSGAVVVGWTPGGEILYSTAHDSRLPGTELARLDPATGRRTLVPLAQASDGTYTPDGKTLFFTRFAFQGSHTKRYKGGAVQNLWRYSGTSEEGDAEAVPLTADFAGTSKAPMLWQGRIYFVSDRDGTMNLWSMDEAGKDLHQLTFHQGWDVTSPDLSDGRIVYQLGADLRLFDIAANQDAPLPVAPDLGLRSAPRDLGEEAGRLPDRGPALADRGPPRADRPRPGVRGAGEGGADRRGHPQAGRALSRGALPAGRQERLRAVGRDRRGRVLEVPGQRRRQARAAHLRRQGAALGGGGLARRPLARPSRQGPAALAARPEEPQTDAHRHLDLALRRLPGPRLVAGQPLARLVGGRRQLVQPDLPLRRRDRQDRGADHRPLQQHEPGLEPRRQVDLLPLRPQPAHPRPLPLGCAPAGPLPDGDHRHLRHRPEEGHPLPFQLPDELHPAKPKDKEEAEAEEADSKGDKERREGQGEGQATRTRTTTRTRRRSRRRWRSTSTVWPPVSTRSPCPPATTSR